MTKTIYNSRCFSYFYYYFIYSNRDLYVYIYINLFRIYVQKRSRAFFNIFIPKLHTRIYKPTIAFCLRPVWVLFCGQNTFGFCSRNWLNVWYICISVPTYSMRYFLFSVGSYWILLSCLLGYTNVHDF